MLKIISSLLQILAFIFFFIIFLFSPAILLYFVKRYESPEPKFKKESNTLSKIESAHYKANKSYKQNIESVRRKKAFQLQGHHFKQLKYIKKDGMSFHLFKFKNIGESWYKVKYKMPKDISGRIDLKIENRSILSKLFGRDRGEYSEFNRDFSIKGSNLMLIKFLLRDPKHLKELEEAIMFSPIIDTTGICEFTISEDIGSVIKACNEILDLINVIRNFFGDTMTMTNQDIHQIIQEINLENIELKCVICFQNLQLKEAIILNCCSSIGHTSHLKDWIDINHSCPYCRNHKFDMIDPINT